MAIIKVWHVNMGKPTRKVSEWENWGGEIETVENAIAHYKRYFTQDMYYYRYIFGIFRADVICIGTNKKTGNPKTKITWKLVKTFNPHKLNN